MTKPTPRHWSAVARCPRCGQLVRKETATKIGKRFYGPECAQLVLANITNLRVVDGEVTEAESKTHRYMRRRVKERET